MAIGSQTIGDLLSWLQLHRQHFGVLVYHDSAIAPIPCGDQAPSAAQVIWCERALLIARCQPLSLG
jgi:hypothetical protein